MRFQHNIYLVVFVSTLISRICIYTRFVCLSKNVTNIYSQSPFQIILFFLIWGLNVSIHNQEINTPHLYIKKRLDV